MGCCILAALIIGQLLLWRRRLVRAARPPPAVAGDGVSRTSSAWRLADGVAAPTPVLDTAGRIRPLGPFGVLAGAVSLGAIAVLSYLVVSVASNHWDFGEDRASWLQRASQFWCDPSGSSSDERSVALLPREE